MKNTASFRFDRAAINWDRRRRKDGPISPPPPHLPAPCVADPSLCFQHAGMQAPIQPSANATWPFRLPRPLAGFFIAIRQWQWMIRYKTPRVSQILIIVGNGSSAGIVNQQTAVIDSAYWHQVSGACLAVTREIATTQDSLLHAQRRSSVARRIGFEYPHC